MADTDKKIDKCRCSHYISSSRRCCENRIYFDSENKEHWSDITEADCELCPDYKSRYIEYPITVNKIENDKLSYDGITHDVGCCVAVRLCREEYGNKTYFGFYLGNLP